MKCYEIKHNKKFRYSCIYLLNAILQKAFIFVLMLLLLKPQEILDIRKALVLFLDVLMVIKIQHMDLNGKMLDYITNLTIYKYNADYFIPDIRSGGETLFNRMTMPWDKEKVLGNRRTCGLTVSTERDLQVVPDNKIQDLIDRTVDKNALPCIIPMIGTADLNAQMWVELKKQLESNNIKFLISCQEKQTQLEDSGEYFDMTSEEFAQTMLPYGQVEFLITEAINLSAEFKDGRVKLREPRSMTKDRAVCLAYGNYIASKIENKYNQSVYDEAIDYENIQLVW